MLIKVHEINQIEKEKKIEILKNSLELYTVTGKNLVTNFQIAINFYLDDARFRYIHHFNPDSIIFLYLALILF